MKTELVPNKTTDLTKPLIVSQQGYEKAVSILASENQIDERTRLLPVEVCNEVIARIEHENGWTNDDKAGQFARQLASCYPNLKPHNEEGYVLSLMALFASYPESIGKRVADPVRGLASRCKSHPKIADVKEALEVEKIRRNHIKANAISHLQERERRHARQRADWDFEHNRPSSEARREQVEAVLQKFGFRPMPGSSNKSPDAE